MIQLGPQIGWPAQRECNTAHARSRMLSGIVNTKLPPLTPLHIALCHMGRGNSLCKHRRGRGTAVIQRNYRSSEVNKSITKVIIDRNAPRWFTTNRMFSQKPKLIRSVASDGLTNINKRQVSLNIYKRAQINLVENRFQDWKWKWRSKPIKSKISRDLDSAQMHFRSKFGDSSLNGWWVMVWTSSKWGKIWLSS